MARTAPVYITQANLDARPRNLEGYRIGEPGWYSFDTESGDIFGPLADPADETAPEYFDHHLDTSFLNDEGN